MKIGDKMVIHCYKHDGTINHISSEATVLEIKDDMLVCANTTTKITESDGRSYRTKEPSILFFYKDRWFNIISQLKKYGLFYYCNMASPYIVEGNIIKYIDYDLDLRVFPDGEFRVLDKNEYKYHKKIMKYPKEIDYIVKKELDSLIELKKKGASPFNKDIIKKYYEQYQKISK